MLVALFLFCVVVVVVPYIPNFSHPLLVLQMSPHKSTTADIFASKLLLSSFEMTFCPLSNHVELGIPWGQLWGRPPRRELLMVQGTQLLCDWASLHYLSEPFSQLLSGGTSSPGLRK